MKPLRRHEFKYVLNAQTARAVRDYLDKLKLGRDRFAPSGEYTLTSLYFDTPGLNDYYDKLGGLEHRKKLRSRVYHRAFDEAKSVWLEVKRKHDMSIVKERDALSFPKWQSFMQKDELLTSVGNSFSYYYLLGGYQPHIVVRYRRRVYVSQFLSPVRVTLDSSIEACQWRDFRYNIPMQPILRSGAVMEVKFAFRLPWWFKDMVSRFQLVRTPFSKYTNSVDVLNRVHALPR